jgi:hypothetical protein
VVMGITLVGYLLGYLLSIRHGFETFVWTRLGLALGATVLHLGLGWRVIKLDTLSVIKRMALATSGGLSLYLGYVALFNWSVELWMRAATVICSTVVIGLVVFSPQVRSEAVDFLRLVRQRKG